MATCDSLVGNGTPLDRIKGGGFYQLPDREVQINEDTQMFSWLFQA
ncbi:MAG: hypothetical protein VX644_17635 [Planctomycetota bacterium]|nr:hypothetical protein [Planctomycetota bacterium]